MMQMECTPPNTTQLDTPTGTGNRAKGRAWVKQGRPKWILAKRRTHSRSGPVQMEKRSVISDAKWHNWRQSRVKLVTGQTALRGLCQLQFTINMSICSRSTLLTHLYYLSLHCSLSTLVRSIVRFKCLFLLFIHRELLFPRYLSLPCKRPRHRNDPTHIQQLLIP